MLVYEDEKIRNNYGFSMVELLAAVAILGVLAAIAVVSVGTRNGSFGTAGTQSTGNAFGLGGNDCSGPGGSGYIGGLTNAGSEAGKAKITLVN